MLQMAQPHYLARQTVVAPYVLSMILEPYRFPGIGKRTYQRSDLDFCVSVSNLLRDTDAVAGYHCECGKRVQVLKVASIMAM